jgi:hypothetical protein
MDSPRFEGRLRARPKLERDAYYILEHQSKEIDAMQGRDLLSISDLSPDELYFLIRTALSMKRDGSQPVLMWN